MIDTPKSLLECLRNPSPKDWTRFHTLYQPFIEAVLRKKGLRYEDCDELFQHVFAELMSHKFATFEHKGHPGGFRSWLRLFIAHRCIDHWRKQQRSPQQSADGILEKLQDDQSELSLLWDREHDAFIIRRALQTIQAENPEHQRLIGLLFFEDRTIAEVADIFGKSINAIRIVKSRALMRLRQIIEGMVEPF